MPLAARGQISIQEAPDSIRIVHFKAGEKAEVGDYKKYFGLRESADKKYVALGARNRALEYFDDSGKLLWTEQNVRSGLPFEVAVSSSGDTIAFIKGTGDEGGDAPTKDWSIVVVDRAGKRIWNSTQFGWAQRIDLSADGREVTFTGDRVLLCFNVENGKPCDHAPVQKKLRAKAKVKAAN